MVNPGRGIHLRSSARTNTGKVRENNEDQVYLLEYNHLVLAMVADGMGGAAAGEEASRIAIETIHEGLLNDEGYAENGASGGSTSPNNRIRSAEVISKIDSMSADVLSDKLRHVIRTANVNIVEQAQNIPELKGMGTTVTMALVRNTYAIIGHVGDSRAYLVDGHDNSISQITSDHSFVEAMVAAGHISRAEAEDHPMRNVLYRALGQAEEVDVDVYHSYLRVGDRLVLCSDGLTLHVKPQEIARIAGENRPEVASQKLIELANDRGGRDNVSVVVISIEEEPEEESQHQEEMFISSDEDDTLILRDRRSALPSQLPPSSTSASAADVSSSADTTVSPGQSPQETYRPRGLSVGMSVRPTPDLSGGRRSYRQIDPIDALGEGRDILKRDN